MMPYSTMLPELDDVPPLSPDSLSFPSPSSPGPGSPGSPGLQWRRPATASDVLATPLATPIPLLAARKRSGGYAPLLQAEHAAAPHAHSHSRSHSHSHARPTHSRSSSQYIFADDHIPLERGGSTEGRRRSSVFSLGEPAVPNVVEDDERVEALVSTPIPIPGAPGAERLPSGFRNHAPVHAPVHAHSRASQYAHPQAVAAPAAIPDVAPTPPGAPGSPGPSGSSTPRSLGAAVRRRIDRSKAFLNRLDGRDGRDDDSSASTPAPSTSSTPAPGTPGLSAEPGRASTSKLKLKSLIKSARRHRSQSLSNTLSHSSPVSTLSTPSHSPASTPASLGHSHAMRREYPMLLSSPLARGGGAGVGGVGGVGVGIGVGGNASSLNSMTPRSFPIDIYAAVPRTHVRSMSLPHHPGHPPFNVVLTSAGLQPVGSDELVWGTLSYRAPARTDHLAALPRELKVKVFKALLDSYAAHPGPNRWDGLNGGRKELVRLSCVSKEWRSLCFDGQLWSNADFTPFAGVMHPGTLRQILLHARPCIKDLSVRGLDAITGWSLTVRELEAPAASLPLTLFSALTTLDLFGCRDLRPKDISGLLAVSPNLKRLCLKGIRISLAHVLAVLPRYVTALEHLDVSRCWSLEFLDVETFIGSLSPTQKAALRSLRIAGLTSTSGGHLLRSIGTELPNLATLDLLSCKWLGGADIKDYVDALDGDSPLTHLVISGCTNLTTDALELLVGKLPHMTHFEAAGLEPVFYLDPPPTLARLVRTMPNLVRLDLDSTGRYGGVCDRVLDELIPGAVPNSPLVESKLEEVRIGGAKNVTAQGILRLTTLPRLVRLEVDGTEADNTVVRGFLARARAESAISMVDCHRVTHDIFAVVSGRTRARAGWDDYRGTVFAYTAPELMGRPVLKTFWAWRAVRPPKLWRDARAVGEGGKSEVADRQVIVKGAWWRSDEVDDMERGACAIM